jgi:hypothetical protein
LPWFDKLTTGLEEIGAALAALVLMRWTAPAPGIEMP